MDPNAINSSVQQASEAINSSVQQVSGAIDSSMQQLSNLKGLSDSVKAAATNEVSSMLSSLAGTFQLPDISIPKFELPDLNAFIGRITETFDPTEFLNKQTDVLLDQLKKIEDIREALEGTRLAEMAKELAANAGLEGQYLDALKALGGNVAAAFDNPGALLDSGIAAVADSVASVVDGAESLADIATAAANELGLDANAISDFASNITDLAGDALDSAKRAMFADMSGKIGEAVAKDAENEHVIRRGPCGGKTKVLGGIQFDTEEESAIYSATLFLKEGCRVGQLDAVESEFDRLTNFYKQDPKLYHQDLRQLPQTAPQTKAAAKRIKELFDKAGMNESYAVSDKASGTGSGDSWISNTSKNIVRELVGSNEAANIQQSASSFVNELINSSKVASILA